jgi:hypothetical protein
VKIAIVGSPDYSDLWQVVAYVRRLPSDTTVISGCAKGVETMIAKAARLRGLEFIEYLPNWDKYGNAAGMFQSEQIVDHCDQLVAFWDGISKDTKESIDQAKAAGKSVEVMTK